MKYLTLAIIIIIFVLRDSVAQNKLDTLTLLQGKKWELILPSPKKFTTGIHFTSNVLTYYTISNKLTHRIALKRRKNNMKYYFYLSNPQNFMFDTLQDDKITSKNYTLFQDDSMKIKVDNYNLKFNPSKVGKVSNGNYIIAIHASGNMIIYQILELNQNYLKLKDPRSSTIVEFTRKRSKPSFK